MHDPTKVLLGTTPSSAREVSRHEGDPVTFQAGLAVRLTTAGALSLSSGSLIGISLGSSLSEGKQVAIARAGSLVPLILAPDEEAEEGEEYDFAVLGGLVSVDSTGKAAVEGTATQAFYVSEPLDGVKESDNTPVKVILVDMPGGL